MNDASDLERELACFEYWRGVTGVFYARRMKSSPPIVFRSDNRDDLHEQVRQYLVTGQRAEREAGSSAGH